MNYPFLILVLVLASLSQNLQVLAANIERNTCTVLHTPGSDDSPNIAAAVANCTSNSTIIFQQGVDYNMYRLDCYILFRSRNIFIFALIDGRRFSWNLAR
jgi:hypothetical protein